MYPFESKVRYWQLQFWIWGLREDPPLPKGLIWLKNYGNRVLLSDPAMHDGTVYFSASDGWLHAVSVATGEDRWSYNVGATLESSPSVAGSVVYVGSDNGLIHAVDLELGEAQWVLDVGGAVKTRPVLASDTLYVASTNGTLYAIK